MAVEPVRILIADDHLVVREGLRTILEIEDGLTVVGEAADGEMAIRLAHELQPDVILMDLRMPNVGGLEAIRSLRDSLPGTAVVILTTYDDDAHIVQGLQAGARGYLLKDCSREALLGAIRAAARGETLLPPAVAARVVARLDQATPADSALSAREHEVLALVADGWRNKEIAAHLRITERTVKAHLAGIFNKLGAGSRAEAIARAMAAGVLAERRPRQL